MNLALSCMARMRAGCWTASMNARAQAARVARLDKPTVAVGYDQVADAGMVGAEHGRAVGE